jgi:hypothetical protein
VPGRILAASPQSREQEHMTTNTVSKADRAKRRAVIEGVIAAYPDITDDETIDVIHYFRSEATAGEKARIAANPRIRRQYRQVCRDHMLDRLWLVDTLFWGGIGLALVVGGLVLFAGS